MNKTANQWFIGVDGGGSKCKAVVYSKQTGIVGEGLAGRANPLYGLEQAFDSINSSIFAAIKQADLSREQTKQAVVGMGLAGVNVPNYYQAISDWKHDFNAFYLTTDLDTACLGAHNGADGAVIISGTGSCGYAKVGEQSLLLGGHGYALGDQGSGAWLGKQGLTQVLLDLDGLGPKTSLTQAVLTELNLADQIAIVELLANAPSSEVAKLSKVVIEQARAGDAVADAIVQQGADYLSNLARKLFELNPSRFSMIGGVSEPITPWLGDDIKKQLQPCLSPPEMGAIFYAQRRAKLC
ncbi:N-acetylglucosamine kinase [Paraferrimonas sp. SM1919]|uniref:N-acetylglucosamine kinase n=1 Tax=Paraferrimonas sp. SM1919 TaxID=2662263 RepID=UPI0013D6D986|nr:BadF/BadG/BcrA/BcrD ATPase family protein [Paraferrimonas sp. SM1919]